MKFVIHFNFLLIQLKKKKNMFQIILIFPHHQK